MEIIRLKDYPQLISVAAKWFSDKWNIPAELYDESMKESLREGISIPQWYIVLDEKGNIIAGAGIIDNDFHNRKDLTPNLCALYVEPEHRNKGIARNILDFAKKDAARLGFAKLYLVTEHEDFYEKCGWNFYITVTDDEGVNLRMYVTATV